LLYFLLFLSFRFSCFLFSLGSPPPALRWSKTTRSITGVDSFDDHHGSAGLRKGNVLRKFKDGEEVIPQFRTLSGDLPASFKH
jgi:hypothetical protein